MACLPVRSIGMWMFALVALGGCAHGFIETTSVGATFGQDANAFVVTVEVSAVAHERFEASSDAVAATPQLGAPYQIDRYPRNYLGVAATAAVGMELGSRGATGVAAAGVDFLPFLGPKGGMVGFGAQLGYAAGALHGVHVVAPRLWFVTPVGRLAGAPLAIGLMLRGQLGLDGGTGVGPSIVVSRVDW